MLATASSMKGGLELNHLNMAWEPSLHAELMRGSNTQDRAMASSSCGRFKSHNDTIRIFICYNSRLSMSISICIKNLLNIGTGEDDLLDVYRGINMHMWS